jgi:hypothetical protein
MKTCDKIRDLIDNSDYNGIIDVGNEYAIHIEQCSGCRKYLQTSLKLQNITPITESTPELWERFLEAKETPVRHSRMLPALAGAFAGLLIVFALVFNPVLRRDNITQDLSYNQDISEEILAEYEDFLAREPETPLEFYYLLAIDM